MSENKLNAVAGWLWLKRSGQIFSQQPIIGFTFFCAAILLWKVIFPIPIIGNLLMTLIQPVVLGAVIFVYSLSLSNKKLGISETFFAFCPFIPQLLRIGFIYVAGMALSAGFVKIITGNSNLAGIIIGDLSGYNHIMQHQLSRTTFTVLLVPMVISFVLFFATWFAPPLIVLRQCPLQESLLLSLRAASNNYRAFILFGVIVAGSWIAYAILMYLIPGIFLIPLGGNKILGPTISALSSLYWPIVSPFLLMSIYVGYVDVFE